jgi:hypothetical protein
MQRHDKTISANKAALSQAKEAMTILSFPQVYKVRRYEWLSFEKVLPFHS